MIREFCTWVSHPTDETKVRITVECRDCKRPYRFDMLQSEWLEGLDRRNQGALIQHAFPTLPVDAREMLISAICPSCFDAIRFD